MEEDSEPPENQFESSGLTPYKLMMENFQEMERRVSEYSDGQLQLVQDVPDLEWEAGLKEPGRRFILRSKDKTQYQRIYAPPTGYKLCVSAVHQARDDVANLPSITESVSQSGTLKKKKNFFF
jgi:hypothetical protein